jgi:hypothetical protein
VLVYSGFVKHFMETIVELPSSVVFPLPANAPAQVQLPTPAPTTAKVGNAQMFADITRSRTKQTILETVYLLKQATAEQIVRLHWSPGYLRDIRRHLSELVKAEILEIDIPPKQTRFGSAAQVYLLGRNASKYLKEMGHEVKRYRTQGEKRRADPHTLAVNEFLINTLLLERRDTDRGLVVRSFEHDESVTARPMRVTVPTPDNSGQMYDFSLAPDLFLSLETEHPLKKYGLLPEIYTSRIEIRRWREKVRGYLFCYETYKERFGTEYLTAIPVVVATRTHYPRVATAALTLEEQHHRRRDTEKRQTRLQEMLRATEAEIDSLNARGEADLFCFTAEPLDKLTPEELFYSPIWYTPFHPLPEPLLPSATPKE